MTISTKTEADLALCGILAIALPVLIQQIQMDKLHKIEIAMRLTQIKIYNTLLQLQMQGAR